MTVSCILLSAGLSQRFGSPKALAEINGKIVIHRLQQVLINSLLDQIIVVLGADSQKIKPYLFNHKKIHIVHNKNYKFGQTSSFQSGLVQADPQAQGYMLLPVDYPLIKTQTIDFLIENFLKNPDSILIPCCQGRKGHPPVFPAVLKKEILSLFPDQGLNMIRQRHFYRTTLLNVSEADVIKTFNTPEELKEITFDRKNMDF